MSFIPPNWHEEILNRMADQVSKQARTIDILSGIDPDNRPTIHVEEPRDADWLDRRAAFVKQILPLLAEGLREGWCDLEGELHFDASTTHHVEVPNPDFDPDLPNPYAIATPVGTTHITIPRAGS